MAPIPPMWIWLNDAHETEFEQEFAPTLQQLIELIRSDKPLLPEGRKWLADLLDPEATNTPMRLKIEGRKRGPKPNINRARDRWIYERVNELVSGQTHPVRIAPMKLEAAVAQVAEEMSWIDAKDPAKIRKPSRASLMKIWSEMRADQEAVDQASWESMHDE